MKSPHRAVRILIAIVLAALTVFGYIVMRLWNWLMPVLFHLPAVTSSWPASSSSAPPPACGAASVATGAAASSRTGPP